MISRLMLLGLCLTLVLGCGQRQGPTRREVSSEPAAPETPDSAAPGGGMPPGHGEAVDLGPEVDLGSLRLVAPDNWTRNQPRIGFVLAEFALPMAEGDSNDGRLTVSSARGTIEENVERWRGQFAEETGKKENQVEEIAGIEVTLVDFSGTYMDQRGPMMAAGVEMSGYRMLAAIIPTGQFSYFIKASGPEKTMAEHEEAFFAFVRSLEAK